MDVSVLVEQNRVFLAVAFSALLVIVLMLLVALHVRLNRLKTRFQRFFLNNEVDLEKLMVEYAATGRSLGVKMDDLEMELKGFEQSCQAHVQRMALVRYNAFDQSGSDLSFSLALMDANGSGVVITSIFGRDETRIYGKPVQNGQSSYHLSKEEQDAIRQALTLG